MNLINAYPLLDWMYRGTRYDLKVVIEDHETGEPYDLTNCTLKLLLADSYTDKNSILELSGSVIIAAEGKASFTFLPSHTENLMSKAYDLTITVTSPEGDPWVAVQGRFGIFAKNPGVAE